LLRLEVVSISSTPPTISKTTQMPKFSTAKEVAIPSTKVSATNGQIELNVDIQLPNGWKINSLAPISYYLEGESDGSAKIVSSAELTNLPEAKPQFSIPVKVSGTGQVTAQLSLRYYYCEDGVDGLCKMAEVSWKIPLEIVAEGGKPSMPLTTKPELGL
ncbi:MAG: hypothetical protein ACIALR_01730, partial [Blastopirellula sp. JB062]